MYVNKHIYTTYTHVCMFHLSSKVESNEGNKLFHDTN